MKIKAKNITTLGICTTLAMVLSYLESLIPLSFAVPGIKLGLANIVTLAALYLLRTKYAFRILLARCFFGSVFGGGITALCFSLLGGCLALGVMALAKKLPFLSIYGVSILGAAAHNVGQILAAMGLMHSIYIGAYLPYLLIVAVFTGLLTGAACAGVLRVLPDAYISIPAEMRR